MANIADYAEVLAYCNLLAVEYPSKYVRKQDVISVLDQLIRSGLGAYADKVGLLPSALSEKMFSDFLRIGLLSEIEDEFAGSYYQVNTSQIPGNQKVFLAESKIYKKANAVGDTFFSDVFAGYVGTYAHDIDARPADVVVPASDRVVTLSHNQCDAFEAPIEEIIQAVEQDNGIPEAPGLKERLLGQIKAGRELLRSGSFKAYLLYVTLLSGLQSLADRYKGHAIETAAKTLIEMLVKQIFGVS